MISAVIAAPAPADAADCIIERVVVDPACAVTSLQAGVSKQMAFQVFGPGGRFDVSVSDLGAGGTVSSGQGLFQLSDGQQVAFAYTPPSPLPDSLTLAVSLTPRIARCSGARQGAAGTKTFPVPSAASSECRAIFRIDDEAQLGALQFRADYSASGGDIAGCGEQAVCAPNVNAIAGLLDDNSTATLNVGLLTPFGFAAPTDVITCAFFQPGGGAPVDGADFELHDIQAYGPAGEPIAPPPAMSARVVCGAATTTTTTLPVDEMCGRPCSGGGREPQASDALYVLHAALGLVPCDPCVCDVDRSGSVTTTDALRVLARATDETVELECVMCAEPFEPVCG